MNNKSKYFCLECKYAKSVKGVLYCTVYRGSTEPTNRACLDFSLKDGFKRRQPKKKSKRGSNELITRL